VLVLIRVYLLASGEESKIKFITHTSSANEPNDDTADEPNDDTANEPNDDTYFHS
jgi:hypothetical protein